MEEINGKQNISICVKCITIHIKFAYVYKKGIIYVLKRTTGNSENAKGID